VGFIGFFKWAFPKKKRGVFLGSGIFTTTLIHGDVNLKFQLQI